MLKKSYLLSLLLLLSAGGIAYTVLLNEAHDFTQQQCPDCHAGNPVKGQRETLEMKGSLEELCGRCHDSQLQASLSHPIEMTPKSAFPPPDMPLSATGKMTCSTCHDIHASSPEGLQSHFLRRKVSGSEFCSACHSRDPQSAESSGHSQTMGIAHMEYVSDEEGGLIDRVSQMCLTCHDGAAGDNADVQIKSGSWQHGPSFSGYDPQGSHPIGVNYRTARKKLGGLRSTSKLNSAIKLIDGKVGCRSCHDPYSSNAKLLVMSNAGAGLCLECHDK